LIIIFLTACSGGGGGGGGNNDGTDNPVKDPVDGPPSDNTNSSAADFVSLEFDDGGSVTTNRIVENSPPDIFIGPYNYSNILANYDAIGVQGGGIWKDASSSGTIIHVNNENMDLMGSSRLEFRLYFNGNSTGKYSYSNGGAQAFFIPDEFGTSDAYVSKGYQDAIVDINVTRYDDIGGRIQGTYDVRLCATWVVEYGSDCNALGNNIAFSGEFDVTHDNDFSLENEGTAANPVLRPLHQGFFRVSNIYSFVGQGESFYQLQLTAPSAYQGQQNTYRVQIAQPSDDVSLYVYSDAAFSQLACEDTSTDTARKACQFTTDQESVFVKVAYSGAAMGAYYVIYADGASPVYTGEGTVDNPVDLASLPVTHEGSVNSFTNSMYSVNVSPGTTYQIAKYDDEGDGAALYVYDGDYLGDLMCHQDNTSSTYGCIVTPVNSQLFILVGGARSGFGTNYFLDMAPVDYYMQEGTSTTPVDLDVLTIPYGAQVSASGTSYYSFSVTSGKLYTVTVGDFFGTATIDVYDGPTNSLPLPCRFSIGNDSNAGSCTFLAPITGPMKIAVQSSSTYGTSFSVDAKEASYQPQGSLTQPIEYNWQSVHSNVHSLAGEVDTSSSYYAFTVPQDDADFRYVFELNAIDPDIGLSIYDDAAFSNLLCSSVELGVMPKPCVVNPSSDYMYVKVDGSLTQGGSSFTLSFAGPLFLPQGSLSTPVDLGSVPFTYSGEHAGTAGSFYSVVVQPGVTYQVTLNELYRNSQMTIYSDPGFSNAICPPGKVYDGLDFSERCIISPTSNQLYIKVSGYSGGGSFDLKVSEFNGATYYVELVPNGIGAYAKPYVNVYEEGSDWSSTRIYTSNNVFPNDALVVESGKTYYLKVSDSSGIGGAYSISISRNGFGAASSGVPEIPDIYEPMDNKRENATLLTLDEIQDHSFSFNNGDFGDEDWFVFTVP
jgi:hypothetical protein